MPCAILVVRINLGTAIHRYAKFESMKWSAVCMLIDFAGENRRNKWLVWAIEIDAVIPPLGLV